MRKPKRLLDTYRFPGFIPCSRVRGIFGDPMARVLTLQRRGKKQRAVHVAGFSTVGTTAKCAASGIFRVGITGE